MPTNQLEDIQVKLSTNQDGKDLSFFSFSLLSWILFLIGDTWLVLTHRQICQKKKKKNHTNNEYSE